ncbi:Mitochondrial dicarboxylate transporter [Penicillium macrosclerotiorum]|uniref:Mitochondrial dicarboxylate transporter n=1 Tax=Penicillium macrosclerotiorum TaxID=303699 RepID=UPI00254958DF|nr:Mitochondrial dicarboxylate transporter [Penicillium macrosclerotiorum]KAJ5688741.1 Mitochondrial dicarboxylate transporter [Penicillium macrosclerotiorum]
MSVLVRGPVCPLQAGVFTGQDQNREFDWVAPPAPIKAPGVIGHDTPSAGAAERRFGGLICLRWYWRSKITSNVKKPTCEMADSGKLLEAPTAAHARVAPVSTPSKPKKVHYPFWFGGSASCFAAAVTHPLDLVKVRLQTRAPDAPRTMIGTFGHIVRNNGVFGLYSGLSAAMLRQMTYSTTRFGIYEELKSYFAKTSPNSSSSSPGLLTLLGVATASGFIGGIAGNPADVLNVRMQHDASLPPEQRRNYRHALHGLVQMTRSEGVSSLFRGVWPNSTRAILMTASQLASYDTFKRLCIESAGMSDNLATHFTASFMAGFVATTVCSPVDVIKTRIMTASPAESRGHSMIGLLRDICRKEGLAWTFRGWVPSFIRLGPHTIATFIFLEEHKKLYRKLKGI